MKDETRSAAATSHGIEPKHQFEHAPTVIHDPEEDMTLLARWLKHGLEEGGKFWVGVAGVVVVVVVLAVLGSGILNTGGGEANSAWSELVVAQNPGQKLEVAEDHPNSKAATAARLQAASEFFLDAIRDLPNNKDAALPQLRKSLDLYQTVAREAAKDSPEAVAAAFGVARAHEARNELPEAIRQYNEVIKTWPNSDEAKDAQRLVKLLQDPEVIAFYKDLYNYKPPTATLPPGASSSLDMPGGGLPLNHPDVNGPTIPAPGLPTLPPLPPPGSGMSKGATGTSGGVTPGSTAPPAGPGPLDIAPPPATPPARPSLPADPFAKPATPKAETKGEATKPSTPSTPTPPATPAKPAAGSTPKSK